MNILDFYQALLSENDDGNNARKVLMQTHWFSVNADFDPKSGEALPQSLTHFLKKITNPPQKEDSGLIFHDRLWRIVSHCRMAIEHIIFSLNENPQREHALLPIRAVRELDASSFIKLSTRPGRNVREKLAGKPYLQAVRRYQSVNLPENRLFKAFLNRLLPLLKKRHEIFFEAFQEDPDALIPKIENWLRSDEAMSIARWENLPPNNTLLSHRDYRRIWDSWIWLQSLDADIKNDFDDIMNRQKIVDFWNRIANLKQEADVKIAEFPVLFDYNHFRIWALCDSKIYLRKNETATVINDFFVPDTFTGESEHKNLLLFPIDKPVCVDFTRLRPVYAIENHMQKIPARLVWQRWRWNDQLYDISALQGDALFSNPQVSTITSSDLFFSDNLDRGDADCAAYSIARDLHQIFLNDSMIWLFPDYLSDFELEIIRRNINSAFQHATPLPRSIAAVFQNVDVSRISGQNFSVLIIDILPEHVYATKLVAKYSAELDKVVPETRGFAWERHPSINLECTHFIEPIEYETVDEFGAWSVVKQKIPDKNKIDFAHLKEIPEIGDFTFYVVLTDAPVVGGVRVSELQKKAPGIPLWYDHLPELSTKIPQNGIFDNFFFVKNARVAPKRGIAIDIPIYEKFTLPPGQKNYEFPLQRGSGDSSLRYVASLKSKEFPLNQPTTCALKMTYTYGADKPYSLTFIPDNHSLHPISVEWLPAHMQSSSTSDLYIPDIPARKSWEDFVRYPRIDGEGHSDLLDWITGKLELLDLSTLEEMQTRKQVDWKLKKIIENRVEGTIVRIILRDDKDSYCFVEVDGEDENIYCSGAESNIIEDASLEDVSEGDTVFLNIMERGGRKFGTLLSFEDEVPDSLASKVSNSKRGKQLSHDELLVKNEELIRKGIFSLRFPVLTVWNNGHSLSEAAVPHEFRTAMQRGINNAEELFLNNLTPEMLKDELFFFLCCLHKDTSKYIPDILLSMFDDKKQLDNHFRSIAYAIGDASLKWQQDLLDRTIQYILSEKSNGVAFEILSIVLWRCPEPLYLFSFATLRSLISSLYDKLKRQTAKLTNLDSDQKKKNYKYYKSVLLCKLIELLLAFIRTRAIPNTQIQEIFVPGNPTSLAFVDLLDKITKILVEEDIVLKSRISLQVNKPETLCKTPDLLYALRMYLTGDSGANSICINNISDEE